MNNNCWTSYDPLLAALPALPPPVEAPSPPVYQQRWCHCVIDISTPATLERDFYAWLKGDEVPIRQNRPCCVFASSSSVRSSPPFGYPSSYVAIKSDFDENNPCSVSSSSTNSNNTLDSQTMMQKKKQRVRRKPANTLDKGRGTNLYGRPYCPGRPLCMNERYRIIQLFQAGMKVNAISKQLCISHGCVSKIITRYRETGLLVPSSHSQYRRKRRVKSEATTAS